MILSWMLLLLVGGAVCGSAWGASAMVIQVRAGQSGGDTPTPALLAEPGEANRVRVAPGATDRTVLIEDLGAVLEGCVAVDAHHARCDDVAPGEPVLVHADDLDDVVVALPGTAIDAYGGPGADRLTGADRSDRLFGGGGAGELLAGMGGDDVLGDGDGYAGEQFEGRVISPSTAVDADVLDGGAGNDVVSYSGRATAVHVDLGDTMRDGQAAEGDVLMSIEGAYGGRGADRLTGSAQRNVLEGGAGRDVIDSGAGDDLVTGGKGDDRVSLGSGDDVVYEKRQRAPAGRDHITCGTGSDHIRAQDTHVGRLARDCELFTAVERVTGASDAVTVPLRGVRRSGTTARVAVRCARAKGSPACIIAGRLRAVGSSTTLAAALAPVKVTPGRRGTLRLRLTPGGRRRVRPGKHVRLLVAERSAGRAGFRVRERARAQAQVVVR